MIKQFFVLSVLAFFTVRIFAQDISDSDFNKLANNKPVVYFDKANKRYFGCGMNLDCMGLQVIFKTAHLDKGNKELRLSGYVNPITTNNGDTNGTNIFRIFIATPVKGKLKNIRVLADVADTVQSISATTTIDLNNLSFKTEFKFLKRDCLYIESGSLFRLKEYCIGSLLNAEK